MAEFNEDKKLVTLEQLTHYTDTVYEKVKKTYDYQVTQVYSSEYTYQGLLKLSSNTSYHILGEKSVNGTHTLFEVFINTNYLYESGFGINLPEDMYIVRSGQYDRWLGVHVVTNEHAPSQTYYFKVIVDSMYTKWSDSVSIADSDSPKLTNYKYMDVEDIIKKYSNNQPINPDAETTQEVTSSNGVASITSSTYIDYIIDNLDDNSETMTINLDSVGDTTLSNGVYRFSVKSPLKSVTLVDGDLSTTYDATNIDANSTLTYTKTSDTSASFTYTKPNIYSSDLSLKVQSDANDKIDVTTNLATLTKSLLVTKDNVATYNTSANTLVIPLDITSIYIDQNVNESADYNFDDYLVEYLKPVSGSFKNGQRITISGCYRLGSLTSEEYALAPYYDTYMRDASHDSDHMDDQHAKYAYEEFIYWNGQWYSKGYIDANATDNDLYWNEEGGSVMQTLSIVGDESPITTEGEHQYTVSYTPSDVPTVNIKWTMSIDTSYAERSTEVPTFNNNGLLTVKDKTQQYITITATDTISGLSDSKTIFVDTLEGASTWAISGNQSVTSSGKETYVFSGTFSSINPMSDEGGEMTYGVDESNRDIKLQWSCSDNTLSVTPSEDTLSAVVTFPSQYKKDVTIYIADKLYKKAPTASLVVSSNTYRLTDIQVSGDSEIAKVGTYQYTVTLYPTQTEQYDIHYSLSDTITGISIDEASGLMTITSDFVSDKTFNVIAKDTVSGISGTLSVHAYRQIESITVTGPTTTIEAVGTYDLSYSVSPNVASTCYNVTLALSPSASGVTLNSSNQLVLADTYTGTQTFTITATDAKSGVKGTYEVNVDIPNIVHSMSISSTYTTLTHINQYNQYTAVISPTSAEYDIEWVFGSKDNPQTYDGLTIAKESNSKYCEIIISDSELLENGEFDVKLVAYDKLAEAEGLDVQASFDIHINVLCQISITMTKSSSSEYPQIFDFEVNTLPTNYDMSLCDFFWAHTNPNPYITFSTSSDNTHAYLNVSDDFLGVTNDTIQLTEQNSGLSANSKYVEIKNPVTSTKIISNVTEDLENYTIDASTMSMTLSVDMEPEGAEGLTYAWSMSLSNSDMASYVSLYNMKTANALLQFQSLDPNSHTLNDYESDITLTCHITNSYGIDVTTSVVTRLDYKVKATSFDIYASYTTLNVRNQKYAYQITSVKPTWAYGTYEWSYPTIEGVVYEVSDDTKTCYITVTGNYYNEVPLTLTATNTTSGVSASKDLTVWCIQSITSMKITTYPTETVTGPGMLNFGVTIGPDDAIYDTSLITWTVEERQCWYHTTNDYEITYSGDNKQMFMDFKDTYDQVYGYYRVKVYYNGTEWHYITFIIDYNNLEGVEIKGDSDLICNLDTSTYYTAYPIPNDYNGVCNYGWSVTGHNVPTAYLNWYYKTDASTINLNFKQRDGAGYQYYGVGYVDISTQMYYGARPLYPTATRRVDVSIIPDCDLLDTDGQGWDISLYYGTGHSNSSAASYNQSKHTYVDYTTSLAGADVTFLYKWQVSHNNSNVKLTTNTTSPYNSLRLQMTDNSVDILDTIDVSICVYSPTYGYLKNINKTINVNVPATALSDMEWIGTTDVSVLNQQVKQRYNLSYAPKANPMSVDYFGNSVDYYSKGILGRNIFFNLYDSSTVLDISTANFFGEFNTTLTTSLSNYYFDGCKASSDTFTTPISITVQPKVSITGPDVIEDYGKFHYCVTCEPYDASINNCLYMEMVLEDCDSQFQNYIYTSTSRVSTYGENGYEFDLNVLSTMQDKGLSLKDAKGYLCYKVNYNVYGDTLTEANKTYKQPLFFNKQTYISNLETYKIDAFYGCEIPYENTALVMGSDTSANTMLVRYTPFNSVSLPKNLTLSFDDANIRTSSAYNVDGSTYFTTYRTANFDFYVPSSYKHMDTFLPYHITDTEGGATYDSSLAYDSMIDTLDVFMDGTTTISYNDVSINSYEKCYPIYINSNRYNHLYFDKSDFDLVVSDPNGVFETIQVEDTTIEDAAAQLHIVVPKHKYGTATIKLVSKGGYYTSDVNTWKVDTRQSYVVNLYDPSALGTEDPKIYIYDENVHYLDVSITPPIEDEYVEITDVSIRPNYVSTSDIVLDASLSLKERRLYYSASNLKNASANTYIYTKYVSKGETYTSSSCAQVYFYGFVPLTSVTIDKTSETITTPGTYTYPFTYLPVDASIYSSRSLSDAIESDEHLITHNTIDIENKNFNIEVKGGCIAKDAKFYIGLKGYEKNGDVSDWIESNKVHLNIDTMEYFGFYQPAVVEITTTDEQCVYVNFINNSSTLTTSDYNVQITDTTYLTLNSTSIYSNSLRIYVTAATGLSNVNTTIRVINAQHSEEYVDIEVSINTL